VDSDTCASQWADCTYVCFMVWPQIACLIAIKKQRPHIPKNNKKKSKTNNAMVERKYRSNFHEISRTAERHKTAAAKCSREMENGENFNAQSNGEG